MRTIYGEVNFPFSFCFLSSSIASAVGFRGRFCTDASTGAAQMLRQLLHRCFGSCCADVSAVAAQVLRQVLHRCFDRCCDRCCAGASAGVAQMLRQLLRRCFGSCCTDVSTVAAQMLRQVLRPGCERCLACGHRSGVECRDKGNGVAGNIMSINEISILVVRYCTPRECLC